MFSSAHSVGIQTAGSLSVSGEELDHLSHHPQQLQASVQQATVFYRVTPRHKVIIVKVSYPHSLLSYSKSLTIGTSSSW